MKIEIKECNSMNKNQLTGDTLTVEDFEYDEYLYITCKREDNSCDARLYRDQVQELINFLQSTQS